MSGRWRISSCDHHKEMVFRSNKRKRSHGASEHGAWRNHTKNSDARLSKIGGSTTTIQSMTMSQRQALWIEQQECASYNASTNQAINSNKLDHYMDFLCCVSAGRAQRSKNVSHQVVPMIVYSERAVMRVVWRYVCFTMKMKQKCSVIHRFHRRSKRRKAIRHGATDVFDSVLLNHDTNEDGKIQEKKNIFN